MRPWIGVTPEMVALGDRIYRGQIGGAACTGCHGANGTGSPLGPDLTGKKWLWSDGSFAGILKSITEGVPNPKQYRSPMPPMGGAQLTPDQTKALAAYVWSLGHQAASPTSMSTPPTELVIAGERIFTESITSSADGRVFVASGPRPMVQDYYGKLSTSGWRELLADFVAGPQTRLIAIKVMRVPGNPLIKGTFWLDGVKLTLAPTAAADQ